MWGGRLFVCVGLFVCALRHMRTITAMELWGERGGEIGESKTKVEQEGGPCCRHCYTFRVKASV